MSNILIEKIEKLTGRKIIQEKMSCLHDGKTPMDELVDLALMTRETFREDPKIGKPGKKLSFIHSGMLGTDLKLKAGETKKTIKEKRKLLKRLEKAIAKLEKMV